jgi:hypothetical protein
MLIYLALLIPIISTLIFYLWKKHEFKWWEFFIPIFGTLIVIIVTKLIFDTSGQKFDEWWGSSVITVYEEEPWNEWIHQTCTESYPCGTDANGNTQYCTRTYDCSYQADYGPEWYFKTDIGETVSCNESDYEEMLRKWGTPRVTVQKRKNHAANDRAVRSNGTKFEGTKVGQFSYVFKYTWDGKENNRVGFASKHKYKNRVKASDLSVFNIKVVTPEEAIEYKLFEYPDGPRGRDGLDFPTILGETIPDDIHDVYRAVNGKFGKSDSVRLWILVFPPGTPSVNASYQQNYWVNGNKNEIVLCMALDQNKKVEWADAFSWGKPTGITAAVKREALNYTFDDTGWLNYASWLDQNLQTFAKREFTEEFSYVKLKPTKKSIITIIILAILFSIGTNIWAISNNINDKPKRNWGYGYRIR